ncbi:DNA cytosine methyltransferase [Agrobacterium vitis]|uniref:DNA cytosine methyltransferase n=1 Tax=Agrobacterium vitis TaxID=373 RepID=UPI0020349CEA|nr:DNA cytosine methyltransferase [Agrobacterium vitis]MCM2453561.1 DNA cytosine methyltransferase [Agrobacterium vitis]MCM2471540.1 DNA cytosine methyltransferase [Agrobacterium vitis]
MTDLKLKVVDLFAGAGGFSLSAVQAGCEIVFAVEFDKNAATTYKHNIGAKARSENVVVYNDDITSLGAGHLAQRHFPNGDCDLLLGGPPCQGFSAHRINDAGVDDPRNALIHEYFAFVRSLKPRAFLMENVPGMLWPRHRSYLDEFYRQALDSGYTLYQPQKLDARDYGIPQRRQRVFILGIRDDISDEKFEWPPKPSHSAPELTGATGLKPWVSCETAFVNLPADDINGVHMNHSPELVAAFERTPANGGSRKDSGRLLNCHIDHDGHNDVYGRIDSRKPAPTMTTACINPSKGRFVHPVLNHGITARQAARIQTFPDDYTFFGGLMAAGKQIGNAVPVAFGQILIERLKLLLVRNDQPEMVVASLHHSPGQVPELVDA